MGTKPCKFKTLQWLRLHFRTFCFVASKFSSHSLLAVKQNMSWKDVTVYSQSHVFSCSVFCSTGSEISYFGSSEHGKKSTSKIFLPSLQSVSQQTVSSIKPMKKFCHINFKDNPKRWATAKSPSKNMHTLNLNVILQFQIFSQSKTLNCLPKRSWLCSNADMTIHNLPYEFGYKHPTIHLSQFHPAEG